MMPDGVTEKLPVASRHRELKIVQSIREIERPTVKLLASEVVDQQGGNSNILRQNV